MFPDQQRSVGRLLDTAPFAPLGHPGIAGMLPESMAPIHQKRDLTENSHLPPENRDILNKVCSGDIWVVNSRRRNGLILHKQFYTEFAGPGAAVGGQFDADCLDVIPLGNLSLLTPDSLEEQQKALRIRLQWIRLTQNFTDKPISLERAQMILEQFKNYFDQTIVDEVPDEAFALLVGVLPATIRRARRLI